MHTGMFWFDNSKEQFSVKVQKAIDYYERKYGRKPNLCLVHPSTLGGENVRFFGSMEVRTYRPVLPGHIWVGIADVSEGEK